jgi:hypothetical protein
VVVAWPVSLTGMLVATATPALATLSFEILSFEELRRYLAHRLAPSIVVVSTLLMGVGYMAWKAVRGTWCGGC